MLSKDALQYLQAQNVVLDVLRNGVDAPFAAVPPGYTLESLAAFRVNADHFEETYQTNDIESFAEYCTEYMAERVFIKAESMTADVVFDSGTPDSPLHRKHKAKLVLKRTPLYNAVTSMDARREISQRDLADWMQDWRNEIMPFDGNGDAIEVRRAVQAIRNFSIQETKKSDHVEETLKASRSAFASIEATSNNSLPDIIVAKGEPYLGLPPIDMTLRVKYLLDDPPEFRLTLVRPDVLEQEIARSFVAVLRQTFTTDGLTPAYYMGGI